MRQLHLLLLFLVFMVVGFTVFSEQSQSDPKDEARKFVELVGRGQIAEALGEFGDNSCRCAPRGGYKSYLEYESGVDPNISFLLRQDFTADKMRVKRLEDNQPHFFPWDRPESTAVDVQIVFNRKEARPYFLPLDAAYGEPVPEDVFERFCINPAPDAERAFSLRLRPSLRAGFIPAPHPTREEEETTRTALELLPPEMARYVYPKDAAGVRLANGTTADLEQVAGNLPRLKSVVLRLYVVRRGQLNRWTIKKLKLHNAVLISVDGQTFHVLKDTGGDDEKIET